MKLSLMFAWGWLLYAGLALAGSVHGYVKHDGTYVGPYMRSNPNSIPYDNYSYHSGNSEANVEGYIPYEEPSRPKSYDNDDRGLPGISGLPRPEGL